MQQDSKAGTPVLSGRALSRGYRLVWALCLSVYLTIFISGVQAGAADLNTMLRAMGFTLATAFVGKLGMSVLSQATHPQTGPPSATEDGTVGSLVDMVSSPNVTQPQDKAEAA
jgi:hypothetical protein